MTLDQRYKVTASWTASHIIQDQIAMFGGDSEMTEHQEQMVKAAEVKDAAREVEKWKKAGAERTVEDILSSQRKAMEMLHG